MNGTTGALWKAICIGLDGRIPPIYDRAHIYISVLYISFPLLRVAVGRATCDYAHKTRAFEIKDDGYLSSDLVKIHFDTYTNILQ